jgi:site-specific recombinase XerD
MYKNEIKIQKKYQPSTLQESFLDFILSRQAMLCTPRTLKFYRDTLGKLLEWLQQEGVSEPEEITARHIREFLAGYAERGCSDSYVHTYARSARTFLRFLYAEEYIPYQIKFQMPKIGEMRLPVLSVEEVKTVLKACYRLRDKAIILLMVDTGIRQAEVCALDWGDIDLHTGICIIRKGKGKKYRSVVLGTTTRRTLLSYRRNVQNDEQAPVFQISSRKRLSPFGLRSMFVRLSKLAGVHLSAHALRRTFVVMSLQSGMSLAHVQALMGHSTPKMTLHYARLVDDDLLMAHREHGPVDSFLQG